MTFLLWTNVSPALAQAARLADRGTGSVGWWADLWTVIAGVMYILLGLILLAILLLIYFFGRKGMNALHRLTREKGVPALDRARGIVERIEQRTASFPGAPNSTGGVAQIAGAVQQVRETKPPFRSRKRTWIPFK
ncbi:MAG TPA: hypothetical protein VFD32_00015 [Dehalococcoidia bacterium]|nr:hypothetical protein [Dehalococcoidia bacterium]